MPLCFTDMQQAYSLIGDSSICLTEGPQNVTGIFVRSIYCPKHGYKGTLYGVGESCLVSNSEGTLVIIVISDVFTVNITGLYYHFIKGSVYDHYEDDD